MKRLLCIVGGMNAGGAETFLMKLYRSLDHEKYQMDFCVSKPEKGYYDDEILSMGGHILHTTAKSKNPLTSFCSIIHIVRENKYKYVLRVSQHSLSALELIAAKLGGAKVCAFRSSNSVTMGGAASKILHRVFRFLPRLAADIKIAPSMPAAEFMYGKRCVEKGVVLFLNNGIPLAQYTYSDEQRKQIRNELGLIHGELLLGHIGRFAEQKNHRFLLEIFGQVLAASPDAHLMLVGEGELEPEIKKIAEKPGFRGKVHFMGLRSDVPALLSAMDVFVFPSLYEGMPNTVIEAQANGVPCVIADTITPEIKMTNNLFMLPLGDASVWADAVVNHAKRVDAVTNQQLLCQKGYDIETVREKFVHAIFEDER